MNARHVWLLVLCSLTGNVSGQRLEPPDLWPEQWSVYIALTLSQDLVEQFLEEKPTDHEYIHVGPVEFRVGRGGGLHAPRKHPTLTGKLLTKHFAEDEEIFRSFVAHVPIIDQELVYRTASKAIIDSKVFEDAKPKPWDASGVDVTLLVVTNDISSSVHLKKVQPDGLPQEIVTALASVRRNLPADYARLFDFLRVPKLAGLAPAEANRFARCRIHGEWMSVVEVSIIYGLMLRREAYENAANRLFPNASNFIAAGCVGSLAGPESSQILHCSACQAAEKKWLKENEPQRGIVVPRQ